MKIAMLLGLYQAAAFLRQPTITASTFRTFTTTQRLERIISNRGAGTRTEVTKLIQQGRVAVEGRIVKSGATKFPVNANIEIDGRPVEEPSLLMVYHKPVGILTSIGDPWNRPNLQSVYTQHTTLNGFHPVGRLDCDTSGLLLFSKNGDLTQKLLNPVSKIRRIYEAYVLGKINQPVLAEVLKKGVKTTEGIFDALLIHSYVLEPEKSKVYYDKYTKMIEKETSDKNTNSIQDNDEFISKELNSASNKLNSLIPTDITCSYIRLSVTEGKYRMVRRILHNAGHSVITLHRVSYGNIQIGNLKEGEVRTCTTDEAAWGRKLIT